MAAACCARCSGVQLLTVIVRFARIFPRARARRPRWHGLRGTALRSVHQGVVDLLRPLRDVRLPREDGRRVLQNCQCFDGRAALALRLGGQAEVTVRCLEILPLEVSRRLQGAAREDRIQRHGLRHQERLGVPELAPLGCGDRLLQGRHGVGQIMGRAEQGAGEVLNQRGVVDEAAQPQAGLSLRRRDAGWTAGEPQRPGRLWRDGWRRRARVGGVLGEEGVESPPRWMNPDRWSRLTVSMARWRLNPAGCLGDDASSSCDFSLPDVCAKTPVALPQCS